MKRFLFFSLAASCFSVSILMAQNKIVKTAKKAATPKPKYKPSPVYLGYSELRGGTISKQTFDSLITQGLTARDSAGTAVPVIQFRIYYKERNLYEDSVGNYYMDTELLTDFSKGNKLNSYMGTSLTDRTKKGDTAIFDDIVVVMPDSATVAGLPMTFVIGK